MFILVRASFCIVHVKLLDMLYFIRLFILMRDRLHMHQVWNPCSSDKFKTLSTQLTWGRGLSAHALHLKENPSGLLETVSLIHNFKKRTSQNSSVLVHCNFLNPIAQNEMADFRRMCPQKKEWHFKKIYCSRSQTIRIWYESQMVKLVQIEVMNNWIEKNNYYINLHLIYNRI